MPHEPIIVGEEILPKTTRGGHDMVLLEKYEAPADGDGGFAEDPYRAQDARVAATMMKWLNKHYAGYPWATVADLAQGIVKFNIPVLMGNHQWYVVNLRTHDVIDGLHKGAGEILERYRQPRDGFDLGAFLEAREKHSKLLVPSRLVPE
jgi:hypothetical protein